MIVDCTNTNFITTFSRSGWRWRGREATEKQGGLDGGWLEDGMIRTIGLPPAAIKFSVQTLFHIDCCDISGTISPRQRELTLPQF